MAAAISDFLINHQTEIASSPAYSGVLAKTGWDHPLLSLRTANFANDAKGLTTDSTDSTDLTDCMVPRTLPARSKLVPRQRRRVGRRLEFIEV